MINFIRRLNCRILLLVWPFPLCNVQTSVLWDPHSIENLLRIVHNCKFYFPHASIWYVWWGRLFVHTLDPDKMDIWTLRIMQKKKNRRKKSFKSFNSQKMFGNLIQICLFEINYVFRLCEFEYVGWVCLFWKISLGKTCSDAVCRRRSADVFLLFEKATLNYY